MKSWNNAGKKIVAGMCGMATTALLLVGAAVTAAGIAMVYVPAGVIAGGVMTMAAAVMLIQGGGEDG